MDFKNTKQVATILGVRPYKLQRAIWEGLINEPEKSPSGNFCWKDSDIEQAKNYVNGLRWGDNDG